MSDPRGPEWSEPTRPSDGYPPTTDPAYSGYWAPTYYGPGYSAPMTQPTEQLPPYWQPGTGYPAAPPPPPPPPKSPRWLWVAAAAAVLLVAGLVLALVIVSNSSKRSTVVEPATPTTTLNLPRPTTTTSPPRTAPSTMPLPVPLPLPTEPPPGATTEPGGPTSEAPSGATEPVVYNVSGEGRAINITYVDTGGIMQVEFNVALPWSKEVSLAVPARNSASVAVVNVGRDVTCSVSVNGAQVRQRTGRGLTICTGIGG